MAEVKVIAKQVFIEQDWGELEHVSTHALGWRYEIGPWQNLTESKAINTLAIWGVKETDADVYLHMARTWGEYTLEVKPETPRALPQR